MSGSFSEEGISDGGYDDRSQTRSRTASFNEDLNDSIGSGRSRSRSRSRTRSPSRSFGSVRSDNSVRRSSGSGEYNGGYNESLRSSGPRSRSPSPSRSGSVRSMGSYRRNSSRRGNRSESRTPSYGSRSRSRTPPRRRLSSGSRGKYRSDSRSRSRSPPRRRRSSSGSRSYRSRSGSRTRSRSRSPPGPRTRSRSRSYSPDYTESKRSQSPDVPGGPQRSLSPGKPDPFPHGPSEAAKAKAIRMSQEAPHTLPKGSPPPSPNYRPFVLPDQERIGRHINRVVESSDGAADMSGLAVLGDTLHDQRVRVEKAHNVAENYMQTCASRMGFRVPTNPLRSTITILPSTQGHTCRSMYLYYCQQFGSKPNSLLKGALPDTAEGFTSLGAIDLRDNSVGDKGLYPLLEVCRHCTVLEELCVSDNNIHDRGVEALVEMAVEHPTLHTIDLSSNKRLTLLAGRPLSHLIRHNPNFRHLNVSDCRIPDGYQRRLQQQLTGRDSRRASV